MKPSEGLQLQMDKLQNIGSFRLTHPYKKELKRLLDSNSLAPLQNLDCATCVRKSLYDLIRFFDHVRSTPVLQIKKPITFEKKPIEMTYQELRSVCKSKGIKTGAHPKKDHLIKLLS